MFNSDGLKSIVSLLARLVRRGWLTPRKVWNAAHAFLRMLLLSDRSSFLPPGLVIEPTNFCNLRCPGCGYTVNFDRIQGAQYPVDRFERIIDEVRDHTLVVLLYLSGEPLFHQNYARLVKKASDAGIAVLCSTNASFNAKPGWDEELIEAGLDTIIFSVSGMTQEVYERYHVRGNVASVLKNIRTFAETKKRRGARNPILHIRYLETPHNAHEVEAFRTFATEVGHDVFEVRKAHNLVEGAEDTPPPLGEHDARLEADHYGPKRLSNACHWTYLMPVLKIDQTIVPCCYDFYQIPPLGETGTVPLAQTWNGPTYRNFRRFMASRRHEMPACANCTTRIGFQSEFGAKEIVMKIPRAVAAKVGPRT